MANESIKLVPEAEIHSVSSYRASEDEAPRIRKKPRNKTLIWAVGGSVLSLVLIVSALFAGIAIGGQGRTTGGNLTAGQGFPAGGGQGMMGGGRTMGTRGTVTAVSSSSITIETASGTEATYAVDGTTVVSNADGSTGSVSGIASGASVMIRPSNADADDQTAGSIMLLSTSSSATESSAEL